MSRRNSASNSARGLIAERRVQALFVVDGFDEGADFGAARRRCRRRGSGVDLLLFDVFMKLSALALS
jgi:hypothetical protein